MMGLRPPAPHRMTSPAPDRSPLLPASAIPLAYFALAHAALTAGLLVLLATPTLPGGFFYHPKMVALTHALTLGWLSGSILGALYIVAPLTLGCALPIRRGDWMAFGSYAIGLAGMIAHFWIARYSGMAWSAGMVIAAIAWVGWRVWRGLSRARVPWTIALHVRLAFVNIVAAALAGILIAVDRQSGILTISPLAATYAHAHLAAVGWIAMMVVGVAYRLIPMMIPSAMPSGRTLAWSAGLLEGGVIVTAIALVTGSSWLLIGALLIVSGFASAALQLGGAAAHRRPRPPRLAGIDWSLWQVRGALVWLAVAVVVGVMLAAGATTDVWYVESAWLYGIAGLVGWMAQMVAAVLGRLVPFYAWYRARARRGSPPQRSVHDLISPRLAAIVCAAWTIGVPLLALGLSTAQTTCIRAAAAALLVGVCAGGSHVCVMIRRAGRPLTAPQLANGRAADTKAAFCRNQQRTSEPAANPEPPRTSEPPANPERTLEPRHPEPKNLGTIREPRNHPEPRGSGSV
jgi:hypothetical protein